MKIICKTKQKQNKKQFKKLETQKNKSHTRTHTHTDTHTHEAGMTNESKEAICLAHASHPHRLGGLRSCLTCGGPWQGRKHVRSRGPEGGSEAPAPFWSSARRYRLRRRWCHSRNFTGTIRNGSTVRTGCTVHWRRLVRYKACGVVRLHVYSRVQVGRVSVPEDVEEEPPQCKPGHRVCGRVVRNLCRPRRHLCMSAHCLRLRHCTQT
jgi:hypothetical protein